MITKLKRVFGDFGKFAMRGNVIDLAVGVIIGGAFGKIVSSLVNDVMMPLIGLLIGGVDLTKLTYVYGNATIKYGQFLQNVIDFLIIAWTVFLFIQTLSKLRRKEKEKPAEAPAPPKEEVLLTEIRDLLKAQNRDNGRA
jgi:large conductance mechanosensitive channel